MEPVRCIDSVMKCCQYCKYGYIEYPDYPDTEYFNTSCMYGLEEDSLEDTVNSYDCDTQEIYP